MLTPKQKMRLKALANPIKNKYILGKNEITPEFVDMIDKALKSKELIKISVLKTSESPVREIAFDICSATNSDIVDIIGRVIIIYRKNPMINGINING